jgi:hypothetical protein
MNLVYVTYLHLEDGEDDYDYDEEEKGPALEIYGTDLTLLARQGQLEECFGREKELLELMEILVRRQKNNPVLVGDAGVGKTAIVELFASKIVNNLVPFVLEGRSIISLDLARIVAGSRYRGEFELRFQRVLDEVLAQPNIIIFIDEIHNIGGTGSAEGSLDAANILKPVLSRSGFQCIGATTTKEYQRIEKDPALNRRFQPIKVKEPSVDDTVNILYGLRPSLEAFHNVEILPGALRISAELASRYIYERFLPDKAIDLIDRAAAKEVIRLTNVTEGSVISSLVNAGLNNIGVLRVEAFRRGDIAAEFVFQEIENAYRNFLLRWIETPLSIPEEAKPILSPISQSLFDKMRISVLKRVDELLFSSNKPRSVIKTTKKIKDLSISKNKEIYNEIISDINLKQEPKLSIYRISLFLYGEWLEAEKFNFLTPIFKQRYFSDLSSVFSESEMYNYVSKLRRQLLDNPLSFSKEKDFYQGDIELYEEQFEILSELETKRIEVFKEFLVELKPVLRKGVIESLKYSSDLAISDKELTTIYTLLGYFSTETGRDFLSNLDDPDLIRCARKVGDFTGLKKRITQREIRELLSVCDDSNGGSCSGLQDAVQKFKRSTGPPPTLSLAAPQVIAQGPPAPPPLRTALLPPTPSTLRQPQLAQTDELSRYVPTNTNGTISTAAQVSVPLPTSNSVGTTKPVVAQSSSSSSSLPSSTTVSTSASPPQPQPAPVSSRADQQNLPMVPLTRSNLELVLDTLASTDKAKQLRALHYFGRAVDTQQPSSQPPNGGAGADPQQHVHPSSSSLQLPPTHRDDPLWLSLFDRVIVSILNCVPVNPQRWVPPSPVASDGTNPPAAPPDPLVLSQTALSVVRKLYRNFTPYVASKSGTVLSVVFGAIRGTGAKDLAAVLERTCEEVTDHLPIEMALTHLVTVLAEEQDNGPAAAAAAAASIALSSDSVDGSAAVAAAAAAAATSSAKSAGMTVSCLRCLARLIPRVPSSLLLAELGKGRLMEALRRDFLSTSTDTRRCVVSALVEIHQVMRGTGAFARYAEAYLTPPQLKLLQLYVDKAEDAKRK